MRATQLEVTHLVQLQSLEGTREELEQYLKLAPRQQRFRIVPLPENADVAGGMIRKGMFPQLRDLSEEDFHCAEWRGEETEL